MMNLKQGRRWAMGLACGWMAVTAQADSAATAGAHEAQPKDPLAASAPVPAAVYVSPLRAYRSAHEVPLGDWRAANDNVARIGGWRTYLREAHRPEPAAAESAAPKAAAGAKP
jgi:hypothetical protein